MKGTHKHAMTTTTKPMTTTTATTPATIIPIIVGWLSIPVEAPVPLSSVNIDR